MMTMSVCSMGGGGWTHVFDTRMDDCNNVGLNSSYKCNTK